MKAHLAKILARQIFTIVDAAIVPNKLLFRHFLFDLQKKTLE